MRLLARRPERPDALLPDALLPFAGADTLPTWQLLGRAQSVAARWTLDDAAEVVPALERGILAGRGARLAMRLALELARAGRTEEARAIAEAAGQAIERVCDRARAARGGAPADQEAAVAPVAAVIPALGVVPELVDEACRQAGPAATALGKLLQASLAVVGALPTQAATSTGAAAIAAEVRRAGRGEACGLRDLIELTSPRAQVRLGEALIEAAGRFAVGEIKRTHSAQAAHTLLGLARFERILDADRALLEEATDALVRIGCSPQPALAARDLRAALGPAQGPARALAAIGVVLAAHRARAHRAPGVLRAAVEALAPDESFPTELLERMSGVAPVPALDRADG